MVAGGLAGGFVWLQAATQPGPLLLAPMIGVLGRCVAATGVAADEAARASMRACAAEGGSAAKLIESTLSGLGPPLSADGRFELGYTLNIPLLKLFDISKGALAAPQKGADAGAPDQRSGHWAIDPELVRRMVRTVHDNPLPVIVYLFSTHFGIGSPLEDELARDATNLAATAQGPMAKDRYYDIDIYPWSIARTDNAITRRRAEAVDAVLAEVCRLPAADRRKIRGVTLLGEVHHLFPDFESGMGFAPPYRVSDYSADSVRNFRAFLRQRFASIEALNDWLGLEPSSRYAGFAAVDPPSKDIRTQPLARFTEHIDSFAHGSLPIAGWVARADDGGARWIRIYRNGEFMARVPARLGRQDVLAALPALGTADVGWRWDLDFSQLPSGVHQIDVLMEDAAPAGSAQALQLIHLGSRRVSIMDRSQQTPPQLAMTSPLPPSRPAGGDTKFSVDQPANESAYWFNPLVPLWHEFRNTQVVRYLDYFDRLVGNSCLWDTPRYIHQIVPFTNPGWDANKFAVDRSLQTRGGLRLGVSLYGEPTYGQTFFERLAKSREDRYGVTEFHPLARMAPDVMRAALERHHEHGARFVSFFLEPRAEGRPLAGPRNLFSFDPANPAFGSDRLYESMHTLMTQPPRAAPLPLRAPTDASLKQLAGQQ